jgi:pSer/pThr/pTyr-binding forkhead associated (FHA) protein
VSIGRDRTSTVVMKDPWVSLRHAWLECRAGRWEVVDAGSYHGAWVNGLLVARQPLRHGDRVQVGQSVPVFVEGEG